MKTKRNEEAGVEFLDLPQSDIDRLRARGLINPDGEIDPAFVEEAQERHHDGLDLIKPYFERLDPFFERIDGKGGLEELVAAVLEAFKEIQDSDPWSADLLIDLVERKLQRIQETAAVAFKEVRKKFLREPTLGPKGGESVH